MEPTPATEDIPVALWKYWIEQLPVYFELAQCVLSVLSLPISASIVERSFKYSAKTELSKERNRLDEEKGGKFVEIAFNADFRFERKKDYYVGKI